MTANPHNLVLEPAAQAFVAANEEPPYLFQLPPAKGRDILVDVQSGEVRKPDVAVQDTTLADVGVRILRPHGATGPLPVVLYLHGAGWVFGDETTHDRLVRELADGTGAAVVFVKYDRAPEARYPVAVEQAYAVAKWLAEHGAEIDVDPQRIAVAGDSVGGNMATVLTLLAKQRGDVRFRQQVLFYPVTDANFDTESYHRFATGYFLRRDGMQWFWDQYIADPAQRAEITASPLRATIEELTGLPPALVITAEADVLRDEGEAYADKLRTAGVPVIAARYRGAVHDFVMVNMLRETQAAGAAIGQAVQVLRTALA